MKEKEILKILGRENLFKNDFGAKKDAINEIISNSKFLVIGAAGSIGQSVSKEIFARKPLCLHCIDINENSLVELVRDIRSSIGYIDGDFRTFLIDVGSDYFKTFLENNNYDFIFNLSAMKHVRNEKDPYSLLRMIDTNIFYTENSVNLAIKNGSKNYFCVSTDKAANPSNLMGASKRIMELYLSQFTDEINITSARFANVIFSDGSIMHGIKNRIEKKQPIAAPNDIKRYFITPQESGQLCLFAALFGKTGDLFFPKTNSDLQLVQITKIISAYLSSLGFGLYLCESEEEARQLIKKNNITKWPCYFSESNTTGEKPEEEFYTASEEIDLSSHINFGIIKNALDKGNVNKIYKFKSTIKKLKNGSKISRGKIIDSIKELVPEMDYKDFKVFLDSKM